MSENRSNSIEKALDILLAFTPYNQEMGTVELSQKLGLHKATGSRTILTLTGKAFLQQNPETKKYSLGPAVLALGHAANYSLNTDMVQIAKPFIDNLRTALEETAVFEVLSGTHTVMAYIAEGAQRVRIAGTVGDRLPSNAAAGAKAILAFSKGDTVDRLLEEDLPAFTPNTVTSPKAFRKNLAVIHERGYSLDIEEIDVGISAVGAPVFNHEDRPIAAVVVAGPSQRITGDANSKVVEMVMKTAASISDRLQYKEGLVNE